ncbi:hypothetical protein [Lacticaseibacillus paracasei]|uniref:hypothetical protein n=1 Tax=Lacticaseibacillus paracasei TaxID=1597 RepID=UPI0031D2C1BE
MPTINGRACVVNGVPIDKVFSNGRQVYGRNLLTGTSERRQEETGGDYLISTAGMFAPKKGTEYIATVQVLENDHSLVLQVWEMTKYGSRIRFVIGTPITAAGLAKIVFTAPESDGYDLLGIQLAWANGEDTGSYAWSMAKVEIGTVATPWTPAPEDVM